MGVDTRSLNDIDALKYAVKSPEDLLIERQSGDIAILRRGLLKFKEKQPISFKMLKSYYFSPEKMSYRKVGKLYGVSAERVRQRIAVGFRIIRAEFYRERNRKTYYEQVQSEIKRYKIEEKKNREDELKLQAEIERRAMEARAKRKIDDDLWCRTFMNANFDNWTAMDLYQLKKLRRYRRWIDNKFHETDVRRISHFRRLGVMRKKWEAAVVRKRKRFKDIKDVWNNFIADEFGAYLEFLQWNLLNEDEQVAIFDAHDKLFSLVHSDEDYDLTHLKFEVRTRFFQRQAERIKEEKEKYRKEKTHFEIPGVLVRDDWREDGNNYEEECESC
jgi:hypothetical protein